MTYFHTITSFAELKKQYRTLAITNHPDKGGDTKTMQEINAEFNKLFPLWEHRQPTASTHTGYENDYNGATSKQYTEYVYNEYRWKGCRYKGQSNKEILNLVRQWLKETYPHYKFSVRKNHYNSFAIELQQADFEPFTEAAGNRVYHDVNHYHIENDHYLTDRAKEVMQNVCSYIMSYNYDNSDIMTDYFNTNFYFDLDIGSHKSPYKCVIPQLTCDKRKLAPVFKHPEGKTHKAIRQALNGAVFKEYDCRTQSNVKILGEITYHSNGEEGFSPFSYGGYKTAQKRVEKLQSAGIKCKITGYKYHSIIFEGYTSEIEAALEREHQAYEAAKKAWEENPTTQPTKEGIAKKANQPISAQGIELIDYSEKSFAIVGDTKPIKKVLSNLGGSFNVHLSCGAGWIFPKSKINAVKQTLSIA